jgi:hypothetical protein
MRERETELYCGFLKVSCYSGKGGQIYTEGTLRYHVTEGKGDKFTVSVPKDVILLREKEHGFIEGIYRCHVCEGKAGECYSEGT